jgi:hypothetical protein
LKAVALYPALNRCAAWRDFKMQRRGRVSQFADSFRQVRKYAEAGHYDLLTLETRKPRCARLIEAFILRQESDRQSRGPDEGLSRMSRTT